MQSWTPPTSRRASARYGITAVVVAVMIALIAGTGVTGYAATSGKTITIGESNDDAQRQELLGYFGATGDDTVEIITVADTQKAMADVTDIPFSTAYSSTALTCRDLGEGIDVTAINITKVTPAMYAMALVTAGVGDAELIVAAPANAPAEGLTALAGIFQSWQSNPCAASNTSRARQELALREIALAMELSNLLGQADTSLAGNLIIDVQRNVVIQDARSSEDISAVVASQEALYGITVPEPQRGSLVTVMVDLQKLKIDWSTFSAGWTIEFGTGTVQMRGEGIAIANAQASATAQAAVEQTATAKARKEQTATARAADQQTATAVAEQTAVAASKTAAASAEETRIASENLTATVLAEPTATATATPLPMEASGEVDAVEGQTLSVTGSDGQRQSYAVREDAPVIRDGKAAPLADVKQGDSVALQVDPVTSQVVSVTATPPKGSSPFAALSKLLLGLPLLALIPVAIVLRGKSFGDPFIVKRIAS